jgi:hypothetical protein
MRTSSSCILDSQAIKVHEVGRHADVFDIVPAVDVHLEYAANHFTRGIHHMFTADKDCSGVDAIEVNGQIRNQLFSDLLTTANDHMRNFSALRTSASMNSDIEKGKSGKGFMEVSTIVLLMGVVGLFQKDINSNNATSPLSLVALSMLTSTQWWHNADWVA